MDKFNGAAGTVVHASSLIAVSFGTGKTYYYKPSWLRKEDKFHNSEELDSLFTELGCFCV